MAIYLGSTLLTGAGGSGGSGGGAAAGYVPGLIGFEYLALSGGGAGARGATYGGGGGWRRNTCKFIRIHILR